MNKTYAIIGLMSFEVLRAIGTSATGTLLLSIIIGESFDKLILPTWIGGSFGAAYAFSELDKKK